MCPLDEEMDDKWIEEFLFPEKSMEASGRQPLDFEYIHKELAKPNITLSLLHHEYEAGSRANNKIPYSYRSFVRHYSRYAQKSPENNQKATILRPEVYNKLMNDTTISFLFSENSMRFCTDEEILKRWAARNKILV